MLLGLLILKRRIYCNHVALHFCDIIAQPPPVYDQAACSPQSNNKGICVLVEKGLQASERALFLGPPRAAALLFAPAIIVEYAILRAQKSRGLHLIKLLDAALIRSYEWILPLSLLLSDAKIAPLLSLYVCARASIIRR